MLEPILIADWESTVIVLLGDVLMVRRALCFEVLHMSYKSYRTGKDFKARCSRYILFQTKFLNQLHLSRSH